MTRRHTFLTLLIAILATAGLVACSGSSSPFGPSSSQGVMLQGTVLGSAGSSAHASSPGTATSETPITITVQEAPAITTTISGEGGTFTLVGLPEGSFTLVFSSGGVPLGTITFSGVNANQQITITVQISGTAITLLEQRRNGIGHGDVEIEGQIESVLVLDPAGESRFLIDGHTVVVRPGETSIRHGHTRLTVADLIVGLEVHVKGVWLPAEGTTQPVLAREIKLSDSDEGEDGDDEGDDDNNDSFCPSTGGKVEAEGKIVGKGAADITVHQQGKGDYLAQVDATTTIKKGKTTYTFGDLLVGWRVHVKGASLGLNGSVCGVDATEVKVQ